MKAILDCFREYGSFLAAFEDLTNGYVLRERLRYFQEQLAFCCVWEEADQLLSLFSV